MTETMSFDEFYAAKSPGAKPSKVAGGREAMMGGKDFERSLADTHEWYRSSGAADIFKLPVETRPLPAPWLIPAHRMKSGICRLLAERQRADYAGTLRGGRSVQMEAKANKETMRSMPIVLPNAKSGAGLKAHQFASLARAHEFGAAAALVWKNGDLRLVLAGSTLHKAYYEFTLGRIKRLDRSLFLPYKVLSQPVSGLEAWLSAVAP